MTVAAIGRFWSAAVPATPTLAGCREHAEPIRLRLGLLVNVVDTKASERPRYPLAHKDGAQILAVYPAEGDGPAVAVAVLLLADNRSACSSVPAAWRSQSPSRPTVSARLRQLGRIVTVKAAAITMKCKALNRRQEEARKARA